MAASGPPPAPLFPPGPEGGGETESADGAPEPGHAATASPKGHEAIHSIAPPPLVPVKPRGRHRNKVVIVAALIAAAVVAHRHSSQP